jgi:hypothetical protein
LGKTPEWVEDNLSYRDFIRLKAMYGLRDPERQLEKDVHYAEALEEIRADRLYRAKAAILQETGIEVESFRELLERIANVPDDLAAVIQAEPDWYNLHFNDAPSL